MSGVQFHDLSGRARCGCKGPGAEEWLAAAGYQIPRAPNSAVLDEEGVLVARLARSEFLIEAVRPESKRVEGTLRDLTCGRRPLEVYPVARCDQVIGIEGPGLNRLLRQVCSVDFAPLLELSESAGPVILTSMIGVGVVAWPRGREPAPAIDLWIDPSFAHYVWQTLREVARSVGESSLERTVRGV